MLRAVVDVLRDRAGFAWAGVALVEDTGPEMGEPIGEEAAYPVDFGGNPVAELRVAPGPADEAGDAFLRRVALLISPHCVR